MRRLLRELPHPRKGAEDIESHLATAARILFRPTQRPFPAFALRQQRFRSRGPNPVCNQADKQQATRVAGRWCPCRFKTPHRIHRRDVVQLAHRAEPVIGSLVPKGVVVKARTIYKTRRVFAVAARRDAGDSCTRPMIMVSLARRKFIERIPGMINVADVSRHYWTGAGF